MAKRKKKLSNASKIIKYMFRNSPISRAQIAEDTEITPATVTTNVSSLIDKNIIFELGEEEQESENTVGRRRILIDINYQYAYGVGVEFNQNKLIICLTNLKGELLDSFEKKLDIKNIKNITNEIIEGIQKVIDNNTDKKIIGIGIALPGHLSKDKKSLISNAKLWDDFNANRIKKAFNIDIICENNVRAMSYGEYLFETSRSPENFVFFHIGLGMYCASITDGDISVGSSYVAGEIGHTVVDPKGSRCECGKHGCLQTFSSESWLIKLSKQLYETNIDTILKDLVLDPNDIKIEDITKAYSMGDKTISRYIRDAITHLGITISNLDIIMNPEKILIHGKLFENETIKEELLDYIEKQLVFVDKTYLDNIIILPYNEKKGAIGASAIAINEFFIEGKF